MISVKGGVDRRKQSGRKIAVSASAIWRQGGGGGKTLLAEIQTLHELREKEAYREG